MKRLGVLAMLACVLAVPQASAQTYPSRTITMTASVAIRTFAGVLSKHLSERPNQSDTGNIMILVSL